MKNSCIVLAACLTCFALGNMAKMTGFQSLKPEKATVESKAGYSHQAREAGNHSLPPGNPGRRWGTRAFTLLLWLACLSSIACSTQLLLQIQQTRMHADEVCAITEQERKRIAREIHDSLQQQLSGAALHLETLKGAIQAAPQMIPRLIDEATAMIRHCQIETRHCIWNLRSPAPHYESFSGALIEWMRMRGTQSKDTKLHFAMSGVMPSMSEEVLFQIMRIVQEAINNGLAHAGARQVSVWLEANPAEVFLTVKDDGRGFQPQSLREGHFGISGQRERAQKIGAKLMFSSAPGNGTRVLLRVPVQQPSHV